MEKGITGKMDLPTKTPPPKLKSEMGGEIDLPYGRRALIN